MVVGCCYDRSPSGKSKQIASPKAGRQNAVGNDEEFSRIANPSLSTACFAVVGQVHRFLRQRWAGISP